MRAAPGVPLQHVPNGNNTAVVTHRRCWHRAYLAICLRCTVRNNLDLAMSSLPGPHRQRPRPEPTPTGSPVPPVRVLDLSEADVATPTVVSGSRCPDTRSGPPGGSRSSTAGGSAP